MHPMDIVKDRCKHSLSIKKIEVNFPFNTKKLILSKNLQLKHLRYFY